MSPNTRRYLLAAVVLALLVGLLVWQQRREGLVRTCLETGGDWIGAQSTCRYPDGRILLRPDLKRV